MSEAAAKKLVALLKERRLTVTTAESCTGGGIAAAITAVPGASAVFPGGVVSYSNEIKHQILGVPQTMLDTLGAVSAPVAEEMVRGVAKLMGTDYALSATGLAGPEGDGLHPVGTVFLGLYAKGMVSSVECHFSGTREEVRVAAVKAALELTLNHMK